MKELTEQQVLDVLDCCLNSSSEVECRTCPLRGAKAGQCKKFLHRNKLHAVGRAAKGARKAAKGVRRDIGGCRRGSGKQVFKVMRALRAHLAHGEQRKSQAVKHPVSLGEMGTLPQRKAQSLHLGKEMGAQNAPLRKQG